MADVKLLPMYRGVYNGIIAVLENAAGIITDEEFNDQINKEDWYFSIGDEPPVEVRKRYIAKASATSLRNAEIKPPKVRKQRVSGQLPCPCGGSVACGCACHDGETVRYHDYPVYEVVGGNEQ